MSNAAYKALAEFGGLKMDISGPGVDFAKGSFQLDPTLALGEEDRFGTYENRSRRLYPLGEAYGGNPFLGIDEQGCVFVLMDEASRIGRSIEEALEGLLLGRKMCD
ncbi:SUKH-3 domain-containing protein [Pendulispora brunnea]|uniref:SUKH-3 domain-containing protein n=2 Tax=Pendulispora brunnea TaxID=2905690 RepID=A0ABZ2JU95_9BACT